MRPSSILAAVGGMDTITSTIQTRKLRHKVRGGVRIQTQVLVLYKSLLLAWPKHVSHFVFNHTPEEASLPYSRVCGCKAKAGLGVAEAGVPWGGEWPGLRSRQHYGHFLAG